MTRPQAATSPPTWSLPSRLNAWRSFFSQPGPTRTWQHGAEESGAFPGAPTPETRSVASQYAGTSMDTTRCPVQTAERRAGPRGLDARQRREWRLGTQQAAHAHPPASSGCVPPGFQVQQSSHATSFARARPCGTQGQTGRSQGGRRRQLPGPWPQQTAARGANDWFGRPTPWCTAQFPRPCIHLPYRRLPGAGRALPCCRDVPVVSMGATWD